VRCFDSLGTVIALSDENGDIVERYSYDVCGEPNRVSSVGNPYLFTGRRYGSGTGLYYYRARYYNPHIGRFMQPDPIAYKAGLNYTYVDNDPINSKDPFGLKRKNDPGICRDYEKCRKVGPFYTCPEQPDMLSCEDCCDYLSNMARRPWWRIIGRCKWFLQRGKRIRGCYTSCGIGNRPIY